MDVGHHSSPWNHRWKLERRNIYNNRRHTSRDKETGKYFSDMISQMLGLATLCLVSATVTGLHLQVLNLDPVQGYGLILGSPPLVNTRGVVTDINNKAR